MHEENALAGTQGPLHHPHQQHRTSIGIVLGVEDQGLERRRWIAFGRRQPLDDRFEDVLDALPGFCRAQHRLVRVETEVLLDLLLDPLDIGRRQIDLVDHRHHLEVVLEGEVKIGHGLRLDTLRCVDQQQRTLARHQRPAHLVREVDVTRGVDQVELVGLAVAGGIAQGHRVGLDGDAALALDVH